MKLIKVLNIRLQNYLPYIQLNPTFSYTNLPIWMIKYLMCEILTENSLADQINMFQQFLSFFLLIIT